MDQSLLHHAKIDSKINNKMKSALISAEGVKDTESLQTLKEDFYDVLRNGLKHMDAWRPG